MSFQSKMAPLNQVEDRSPKESLSKRILQNINMTESDLEDGVKHLQDWLSKQPHLPVHPRETMLKSFIIGSKSVERSKTKLDAFYTNRGKYDYLKNRDPSQIHWDRISFGVTLPGQTPEGWKVMFYDLPAGVTDFNYFQTAQLTSMEVELMLRDEPMTSGHAIVCDMSNLSVEVVKAVTIPLTAQLLKMYQSVYPLRIKGLYFAHASSLLQTVLNTFVKPFLSQKLKQKLVVMESVEELKNYVPLSMLPKDYGGSAPPFAELKAEYRKKMESERDWFLSEGSEKSDELKRVTPIANDDELQGTFRKLNID